MYKQTIEYKNKKKVWDRAWRLNNPDKRRVYEQNRRARKRNVEGIVNNEILKILLYKQAGWCYYCLCDITQYFELEHKTPLVKGGSNLIENLCLSCNHCNTQKGVKTELEYFEWKVGLENAISNC